MKGPIRGNGMRRRWLRGALAAVALVAVAGEASAARSPGRHEGPAEQMPMGAAPSIQALLEGKAQTMYAGSFGRGVFRSSDQGRNWMAVNNGLGDRFVLSLAMGQDGTIYAGTFKGGVFRSADGGESWQALNAGLKRLEVKALLVEGRALYAGTGDGVYRLGEADAQWVRLTKGQDDLLVHALAMATDRTLYAGTSGKGVFRLRAHESDWTRLAKGLKDHEGLVENFIRVLAVDRAQALYAGTFDGGVFRSQDGGDTWQPISRALPNDSIRSIVATDKGLIVATGRGIFKTENQGQKWLPLNRGLTELSIQSLVASAEGTLYAGTSAGVFRSDDDGQHWTGISQGMAPADPAP